MNNFDLSLDPDFKNTPDEDTRSFLNKNRELKTVDFSVPATSFNVFIQAVFSLRKLKIDRYNNDTIIEASIQNINNPSSATSIKITLYDLFGSTIPKAPCNLERTLNMGSTLTPGTYKLILSGKFGFIAFLGGYCAYGGGYKLLINGMPYDEQKFEPTANVPTGSGKNEFILTR